jgi:hypothetical protein
MIAEELPPIPPLATIASPVESEDQHAADRRRRARLSKVHECMQEELGREEPFQAVLGTMTAGLMEVGLDMELAILRALRGGPPTVERLLKIAPAVSQFLQLNRHVDRMAQVRLRGAAPPQPAVPESLPPASDGGSAASEDTGV